jgi:ketosteroid isomerase-like protein
MSLTNRLRAIGLAVSLIAGLGIDAAVAQPQPADAALHTELRALRDRAVAAVNKRDTDALMKELDANIVFTAMNNEVVFGIDQAKAYYQRMMVGAGRIVEDMKLSIETDRLSNLYENKNIAVAAGSSTAHFKLTTGMEFDVPMRWSATVRRANGKWSLVNVHFSANMFDNPALDALKASTKWIAIGCGLVALLIGFFAGRLLFRRQKA